MLHLAFRDYTDLETESSGEGLTPLRGRLSLRERRGFVRGPLKLAAHGRRGATPPTKHRRGFVQPDPHLVYQNETIVAVATPPGRGGIGIVRLSGPEATQRLPSRCSACATRWRMRSARFRRSAGPVDTQEKLDEAVVTFFAAPQLLYRRRRFGSGRPRLTGDSGSLWCARRWQCGARLAAPGEFTQRAFLSGRIDLTQAEAVHDLIEAQTLYQARVAAQQLHGARFRGA